MRSMVSWVSLARVSASWAALAISVWRRRITDAGVFAGAMTPDQAPTSNFGITVSATVAERMGQPEGFVRAGLVGYTTTEEVDRLLDGVAKVAQGR